MDISLRAYLSALYLKNDTISISLAFKNKATSINLQHLIEQIDRISKGGYAIELEGMVDFDFKFAEFYYLRDASTPAHTQSLSTSSSATASCYMTRIGSSVATVRLLEK